MELVYQGKQRTFTASMMTLSPGGDDLTGSDGVFDPGANTVGLKVEGAGKADCG